MPQIAESDLTGENSRGLDLLSIRQRKRCGYGAPLVATIVDGKARIHQSNCNHWDCPTCGEKRAAQEYHRIVNGAKELSREHELYFITLTCRGKEISIEEAETSYYVWTNRLLTAMRERASRKGCYWAYAQITERQHKTRKHPHSHCITTYLPDDAVSTRDSKGRTSYVSRWFTQANNRAGLGVQHRISLVETPEAAAAYVAKYLFKDTTLETWPAHWRRVRYSRNWPECPVANIEWSQILRTAADWKAVGKQKATFECLDRTVFEMAWHRLSNISLREE